MVDRADALIPRLRDEDQMLMVGRVSRSIVLRLAVLKGLEALEAQAELNAAPSKRGKSRR